MFVPWLEKLFWFRLSFVFWQFLSMPLSAQYSNNEKPVWFLRESVPYCGQLLRAFSRHVINTILSEVTFRVLSAMNRQTKIIDFSSITEPRALGRGRSWASDKIEYFQVLCYFLLRFTDTNHNRLPCEGCLRHLFVSVEFNS